MISWWNSFARVWADVGRAQRLINLGLEHVAGCTWRGVPRR